MPTQRLLQVSFNNDDAAHALKKAIPSMESGFNINSIHGDMSVAGEDAKAVMDLLAQRLKDRISQQHQLIEKTPAKCKCGADSIAVNPFKGVYIVKCSSKTCPAFSQASTEEQARDNFAELPANTIRI